VSGFDATRLLTLPLGWLAAAERRAVAEGADDRVKCECCNGSGLVGRRDKVPSSYVGGLVRAAERPGADGSRWAKGWVS